jgi:hypothetical protein
MTTAKAGRERVYIPTHRDEDAMNGAPGASGWDADRTTATADPYGMTNKKGSGKGKNSDIGDV